MLRALLEIPGVQLTLLIVDARPRVPRNPWWRRLVTLLRLRGVLYSIYMRYFVEPYCDAISKEDVSSLVNGVPRQECHVRLKGKFSEYFSEEDIAAIRSYELDFILRSGFNIIRGEILSVPRYGVWSFHHDDIEKYRGGPPAFWEIFYGDSKTGVTLQRLTDRLDGGVVLKRVGGAVKGSTTNGGLVVELSGDRWDGETLDVSTTNGGVIMSVPENYSAHVQTGTVNGSVNVEFPVNGQDKRTKQVAFDLGSGGAMVKAMTTNGGVHLKRLNANE